MNDATSKTFHLKLEITGPGADLLVEGNLDLDKVKEELLDETPKAKKAPADVPH